MTPTAAPAPPFPPASRTPAHVDPRHPAPSPAPPSAPGGVEGRRGRAPRRPVPLLVATDGREGSEAVTRVAARLAARLGAAPQALTVLEPVPTYGASAPAGVVEAMERERAGAVSETVRRQLDAAGGSGWPAAVVVGHPSRQIARRARAERAKLVVLGVGRHRLVDRLFGTETALQTLRMASQPVLAVAPEADAALRRVVVAVDFGPASVRAAELACELLEAGGTLSLVHVRPRLEASQAVWEAWDAHAGRRVAELMQRLTIALREGCAEAHEDGAPRGRRDVTIGTATLVGDPVEELLDYAERVGADVLAVGSHGGGAMERLFVGSVAGELLRRTSARLPRCSVLACPEPEDHDALRIERQLRGTTESLDPSEWRLALEGFAVRNVGRRTVLEIDDPALGAQSALRGYALLGATFDPRDLHAELMFGDPGDRRRHLTRTIPRVGSVAVLTGPDGRDTALRIEHGKAQTLVLFADG